MSCQTGLNAVAGIRKTLRKRRRKKSKRVPCIYQECSFSTNSSDCRAKKKMSSDDWEKVPIWYWSNYWKTLEWQRKHKISLWKSYAFALKRENKYLLRELYKLVPGRVFDTPLSSKNLKTYDEPYDKHQKQTKDFRHGNSQFTMQKEVNRAVGDSDDGVAFEMSEEMIRFFEKSFRHKLEMKKLKEKAAQEVELEVKEMQEAHHQREKEMKLLYGDGSSMIIGMETAVQLSFDKYCDMKSPKYWPNIPLKL